MPPEAYARFMGRYAEPLAPVFAAFAGVKVGGKVSARESMKAGMTCDVTYPGNKQTAISIICVK